MYCTESILWLLCTIRWTKFGSNLNKMYTWVIFSQTLSILPPGSPKYRTTPHCFARNTIMFCPECIFVVNLHIYFQGGYLTLTTDSKDFQIFTIFSDKKLILLVQISHSVYRFTTQDFDNDIEKEHSVVNLAISQ